MLNETLQASKLPGHGIEAVRREKEQAIRERSRIVGQKRGCFRDAIRRAFGDDAQRRRPFSIRLLEWIFARSHKRQRLKDCCEPVPTPQGTLSLGR